MKKKLIGLLCLMASITTLSACDEVNVKITKDGVIEINENTKKDDEININALDKDYDGNPLEISASSTSGREVNIYYKLESDTTSNYVLGTPTLPGVYSIKASIDEDNEYNEATSYELVAINKLKDTITLNVQDKLYDGNTASITASSYSGLDVKIEYKKQGETNYTLGIPKDAGEYYIKASTEGNEIYKNASTNKFLTIGKINDEITIDVSDKDYDGLANPITVTTISGNEAKLLYKLADADDNTYTETEPTDAGEYVVKAEILNDINYKDCVKYDTFKINKIDDQIDLNVKNKKYDGNELDVSATSLANFDVEISYKLYGSDDSTYTSTTPKDIGLYIVRAKTSGNNNFNETIILKEVRIYNIELLPNDFNKYIGTDSYVTVSNEKEFLDALYNARFDYTTEWEEKIGEESYVVRNNVRKNETNWKNAIAKGLYLKTGENEYTKIPVDTPFSDTTYTDTMTYYEDSPYTNVKIKQTLNKPGNIRVIEITNDLDLGYNLIKDLGAKQVFENWDKSNRLAGKTDVYADSDIQAAGISKINVSNINDLIIYSKNGAKITHAGFSVSSCKNVQFRNLSMDEIWMWEDSTSLTPTIKVGDYDSFGWAYFKISFSEDILIDHCTFGKSFDGQIDYSNPYYLSMGTYSKAPYLATGNNKLTVSFCDFKAGSSDKDGYIYKMMDKIEKEYQLYLANKTGYTYTASSCRYYFTLRDLGLTFDDIFYGIAIPQKKAFLWGDSGDPYVYNKYLNGILYGCTIKNIEDRLPKVRGGMAYVYNTLVDNTEYFKYVDKLKSVATYVTAANSNYKLGAVSQGILAGLDASIYLEAVEYKGISSYLKNNDEANTNYPTVNGGYMIKNSILGDVIGSSFDSTNPFTSLVNDNNKLSTENFSFKINGEKTNLTESPLDLEGYDLITNGSLESYFIENPTGVFKA